VVALIRYSFARTLHGQRYLAPVLLYVIALGTFTVRDTGTLTSIYAVVAGILLVCSAWLTTTVVNAEDPIHRAVAVVSAGGSRRVLAAEATLSLLLSAGVLTAVGMVLPLLDGRHTVTGNGLLVGLEALLTCAILGVGVGLICSRLVIPRPAVSLIASLLLVIVLLLTRWLPPVNPMLRLLSGPETAGHEILTVSLYLLLAAVLCAAAATATHLTATRRD
jgi:hypothetical protein